MTLAVVAALLFTAAPARAQHTDTSPAETSAQAVTPRSRAVPVQRSFVRAYFLFDSTLLAAADTFDAVIGKTRVSMLGGGGEALDLWKGLFARAAFSSSRETGSRVVVFGNNDVIPLGIPVTIEMRPIEVAAGWRLRPFASGRLVPYAGAGLLRIGYRETSEFASADENTDARASGRVLFGGVEATLVSWIVAGVEVQHRATTGVLGSGGVSQVFGENDLGGTTVRVLIGIRR